MKCPYCGSDYIIKNNFRDWTTFEGITGGVPSGEYSCSNCGGYWKWNKLTGYQILEGEVEATKEELSYFNGNLV